MSSEIVALQWLIHKQTVILRVNNTRQNFDQANPREMVPTDIHPAVPVRGQSAPAPNREASRPLHLHRQRSPAVDVQPSLHFRTYPSTELVRDRIAHWRLSMSNL
jgi:hypothetical protein